MTLTHSDRFRNSWRQGRRKIVSLHLARRYPRVYAKPLAALLLLVTSTIAWAQDNPTVEYQVKAAFLYNFAKFVEWPPDVFANEKSPITLCVLGKDPFGRALDDVLQGKMINGREFLIRRTNDLAALKTCQLAFVSEAEIKRLSEIIKNLQGSSALLVGESEGFAERGGQIQFFLEDKKLRFSVNLDAVQRTRLKVSSKLLALAKIVHDANPQKQF